MFADPFGFDRCLFSITCLLPLLTIAHPPATQERTPERRNIRNTQFK